MIVLDQKDQKIRKNWLKISFVKFVIVPLLSVLLGVFSFLVKGDTQELLLIGIINFVFILYFAFLYYFNYKKFGNRFLFFLIIDGTVATSQLFMKYYKDTSNKAVLCALLFNSILFVFWLYCTNKVIKINKEYKKRLLTGQVNR